MQVPDRIHGNTLSEMASAIWTLLTGSLCALWGFSRFANTKITLSYPDGSIIRQQDIFAVASSVLPALAMVIVTCILMFFVSRCAKLLPDPQQAALMRRLGLSGVALSLLGLMPASFVAFL
ncbi:hypothetical protein [Marilutibacter alkalisoli]|uniref:Uncharacterized protein n=1 Tax=Marilutibacter alkalisoli TaxID=2591633 RepID=A0A514BQN5_9GAMM|nr:hypothetical protein [Lysobacter alkalisoli]QDH69329.1 hypothetical protein FKV23_03860 [Lysobacter alkalisoli]